MMQKRTEAACLVNVIKRTAQRARALDEEQQRALYALALPLYYEKCREKIALVAELPQSVRELVMGMDVDFGDWILEELERLAEPAAVMLLDPQCYEAGMLLHSIYPVPSKTDLDLFIEKLEAYVKAGTATAVCGTP